MPVGGEKGVRLCCLPGGQAFRPIVKDPGATDVSQPRQQGGNLEKAKAGAHMGSDCSASQVLVGVDGVKQDHPGHLVRVTIGKDPDKEPPHGVTDENEGRRNAGMK